MIDEDTTEACLVSWVLGVLGVGVQAEGHVSKSVMIDRGLLIGEDIFAPMPRPAARLTPRYALYTPKSGFLSYS